MNFVRIVLATSFETRDSVGDKDGLLVNGYLELTPEGGALLKRPGSDFVANLCVGGTGQGASAYGTQTVFIACDTLYIASRYVNMTATVGTTGV